ncbi:MAG: hypothetical protein LLG01_16015 [Planctomycetaceae bacterium]|nr:hypothetical protein [Planctomycetaceae bacterium]
MIDARELVRLLRAASFRSKTGVILLPADMFGQEELIAAQLDIQYADIVPLLIQRIPPHGNFLNLSLSGLFEVLDSLAFSNAGMDCVLISGIDVPAMKLASIERREMWRRLLQDYPYRPKGLVFTIPNHMDGVLVLQESSIRAEWERGGRVAAWTN